MSENNHFKNLIRRKNREKAVHASLVERFIRITDKTRTKYENHLAMLQKYLNEMLTLEKEILEDIDNSANEPDSETERTTALTDVRLELAELDDHISCVQQEYESIKAQQEAEDRNILVESLRQSIGSISPGNELNSGEKLPTLQIQPFRGEKALYRSFKEHFVSTIGRNSNLDEVQKFKYLLSYLKDGPKLLVESLPVLGSSYHTALDILERTYSDLKEIKYELALKLESLKPCKADPQSLYNFYCEVESLLRQIEGHGVDPDTADWLIGPMIFNRLPPAVKSLFQNKTNETYPDLQEIRKHFPSILTLYKSSKGNPENQANSYYKKQPNSHNKQNSLYYGKQNQSYPYKQNKDSNSNQNSGKWGGAEKGTASIKNFHVKSEAVQIPTCKFCLSSGHYSVSCDKYTTYEARKKRCREVKICPACTSSNHVSQADCFSVLHYPCKTCGTSETIKPHVSAMCPKYSVNKKRETGKPEEATKVNSNNICLYNRSGDNILLPTITLPVKNAHGDLVEVRAFLDSCSQRTFIGKSLAEALNLTFQKDGTVLNLSSFGRDTQDQIDSCTTNIVTKLEGKEVLMKGLIINKFIDNSMKISGLKRVVETLKTRYELADKYLDSDTVSEIDILIGADNLRYIHKGVVQIGKGLAYETPMGIALLGDISDYEMSSATQI